MPLQIALSSLTGLMSWPSLDCLPETRWPIFIISYEHELVNQIISCQGAIFCFLAQCLRATDFLEFFLPRLQRHFHLEG